MTERSQMLDLDAVQAFVLIAALSNFTRVAEKTGTTQSAVSLKIKRLEDFLGRRLVERTPRTMRLTDEGSAFLIHANELLAANDRAISAAPVAAYRLRLGISDHASGPELPRLLSRIHAADSSLVLDVQVGFSRAVTDAFDKGKFDAVIVRQEAGRRGGETLADDEFGWFAAPQFERKTNEPLRLANLAPPCGVRAVAIRALEKARIPWNEAFVGGGVNAVAAAAAAGLAVAALAKRIAPAGTVDVGAKLKLPRLPASKVMLYAKVSDSRARVALRVLSAAFRSRVAR